jgi:O-antigen/teichoic acid export membrane protein
MEAWVSTFVLGCFAAPEAVGVFSAAYRTSLLVQGILMSFNTVFAPIISDLHQGGEVKKLESLFKVVAKWVFSLSFPAVLLMIIFSQEILSLFGQDFAVGAASLVILSIGQLMNSFSGSLGVMIDMSGRSRIALLNSALHFLLQTGLCFLLIPRYGIVGAALVKAISIGFLRVIRLLQIRFMLRMHPFRIDFLKPLVAGAVAWLALYSVKALILRTGNSALLHLALGSLTFLIIYGFVLHRMGFDEEDRVVFQKIRTRFAF